MAAGKVSLSDVDVFERILDCMGKHTSVGLGIFPESSSTCSRTPITLASKVASKIWSDATGFFEFHIGEAVMPNILGRFSTGHCEYSFMIIAYG
jgi:hypothetical protein